MRINWARLLRITLFCICMSLLRNVLIRLHTQRTFVREKQNVRDNKPVRLCSREERLDMVDEYCLSNNVRQNYLRKVLRQPELLPDIQKVSANRSRDVLDLIPDEELVKLSHGLFLDQRNKVIVCMHAKAGCSTWKTILANNSGDQRIHIHSSSDIHTKIFQYGMTCADNGGDPTIIRQRLRSWYKVAIVRHPYDRLVSAYNDKLLVKADYRKNMGRKMRKYLPDNVDPTDYTFPFHDFVQYVLDNDPMDDDHFKGPYEEKCHACLLHYNYIVKLETNDIDSRFVIRQKLQGMGLDAETQVNSQRPSGGAGDVLERGRDLSSHWRNLTGEQRAGLQRRHAIDLGMYGYSMDERTFQAKCSRQVGGDELCC